MEYKDFLGRDIKVGAQIVYPGRAMSSLWLNKGVVEALGDSKIRVRRVADGWRGGEKSVWLECLNRVVVVD